MTPVQELRFQTGLTTPFQPVTGRSRNRSAKNPKGPAMAKEPPEDHAAPLRQPIRVATLSHTRATEFDLRPDAAQNAALAAALGLLGLRKVRLAGRIAAEPGGGWRLTATLGATVVQPCSVTLAPVTTRIDERVERRYLPDYRDPAEDAVPDDEIEVPDDVDTEALGTAIDPGVVMAEALALALPLYPRAADAELGEAAFTEPGKPAMRDEDARPFAGLAHLRDKLQGD